MSYLLFLCLKHQWHHSLEDNVPSHVEDTHPSSPFSELRTSHIAIILILIGMCHLIRETCYPPPAYHRSLYDGFVLSSPWHSTALTGLHILSSFFFQIKLKNAFSFSYLSNKRRRRTQEDKTPLSFNNTLVLYTMRGNMYRILCCKDNCRRNQERQRKKLAQHTIKRTERLTADVPLMWQMMHTLLAIILLIMRLRVYMQRRQHKHWQEHRQQHQRRIISPCRLFHLHICACKGSTNRVKNQKKSPFLCFSEMQPTLE